MWCYNKYDDLVSFDFAVHEVSSQGLFQINEGYSDKKWLKSNIPNNFLPRAGAVVYVDVFLWGYRRARLYWRAVDYHHSDSYLRGKHISDHIDKSAFITLEDANERYVLKEDASVELAVIAGLLSKVLRSGAPANFVVHGYFSPRNAVQVSYRGPFEWCLFHKGFVPFTQLGSGKSAGGDGIYMLMPELASGSYWIVFIYAGQSFRVEFVK